VTLDVIVWDGWPIYILHSIKVLFDVGHLDLINSMLSPTGGQAARDVAVSFLTNET